MRYQYIYIYIYYMHTVFMWDPPKHSLPMFILLLNLLVKSTFYLDTIYVYTQIYRAHLRIYIYIYIQKSGIR